MPREADLARPAFAVARMRTLERLAGHLGVEPLALEGLTLDPFFVRRRKSSFADFAGSCDVSRGYPSERTTDGWYLFTDLTRRRPS